MVSLGFFREHGGEKWPLGGSETGPNPPYPPLPKGGDGGDFFSDSEFH